LLVFILLLLFFFLNSNTDQSDEDTGSQIDSNNAQSSPTKRRVSFFPNKQQPTINGKSFKPISPTTPTGIATPASTKIRRQRMRTTSRSGDDRITFKGRNTIYTAGKYKIYLLKSYLH